MILDSFQFVLLECSVWSLKCAWLAVDKKVGFEVGVFVTFVLLLKLLGKLQVDVNHFTTRQMCVLFVQMVHDEEIPCLTLSEIDFINEAIRRLLTVNYVAVMIASIKHIVVWVDEHPCFTSYSNLQSNEEQA